MNKGYIYFLRNLRNEYIEIKSSEEKIEKNLFEKLNLKEEYKIYISNYEVALEIIEERFKDSKIGDSDYYNILLEDIIYFTDLLNDFISSNEYESYDDEYEEEYEDDEFYQMGKNYYYGLNDYYVDERLAKKYFEKSLSLGNERAAKYLGIMYFYGDIVKENLNKAIDYFERSAVAGDYESYSYLSRIYQKEGNIKAAKFCIDKYIEKCISEKRYTIKELIDYFELYIKNNLEIEYYKEFYNDRNIISNEINLSLEYINESSLSSDLKKDIKNRYELILFILGLPEERILNMIRETIKDFNYGDIEKVDIYLLKKIYNVIPKEIGANLEHLKNLREVIDNKKLNFKTYVKEKHNL